MKSNWHLSAMTHLLQLAAGPMLFLASITVAPAYTGSLDLVFGDVKQGLLGSGGITEQNAEAVVDGLYKNLKCNGLRVPIDFRSANPTAISPAYAKVLARAKTYKMVLYANPMFTGDHGLSDAQYAAKVIAYANHFRPKYLGCFNESQLTPERYVDISRRVKAGLDYQPMMLGPDTQKVMGTMKKLSSPAMRGAFNIITSHNAAKDVEATAANWKALRKVAGKPLWATENPRDWSEKAGAQEVGVKAVVDAGISGLVLYSAFPTSVDARGNLTGKGRGIASNIGERE